MSPEEPVIELESEFLAKGKPMANGRSIAVRPVHVRNVVLFFGSRIRRCLTEAAGIGGYLHRVKNSGSWGITRHSLLTGLRAGGSGFLNAKNHIPASIVGWQREKFSARDVKPNPLFLRALDGKDDQR